MRMRSVWFSDTMRGSPPIDSASKVISDMPPGVAEKNELTRS